MVKKPAVWTRARLEIMHHIVEFSLLSAHGNLTYAGMDDMRFMRGVDARPGDLVALQSAPTSRHYLSWVVDITGGGPYGSTYGLQSIEDGELVNWSNVSLMVYNRDRVAAHPEWRWTDEQWEFKDRWFGACYKKRNAYIKLPMHPVFYEDGGVTLGIRTRFGLDDERPTQTFSNWRRLTVAQMLAFYDEHAKKAA